VIEQLANATEAELLAEVAELEAEHLRVQYRQLAVLAELNARNTAGRLGFRGLSGLIAVQLRCTVLEARKRAAAVERFGVRRGLTGEPLKPLYSVTAEALAAGEVSLGHAAVIADTIEAIPLADRAEHSGQVETALLEHARTEDPHGLRQLGKRILAHLDPDGPSPEEQRLQQVHRRVTLTPMDDATGLLEGRLSPSCRAIWEAILTPLAERRPDDAMGPDTRTIPQRIHDAFEEAGRRLLAQGDLPDHAGLPCQLVITASLTDLERRAGRATTHHGGTLSINEALKLAAGGHVLPMILDDAGGILAYGNGRRLASTGMRRAVFARDRGCTFPGCPRSAAQSEIHHATDWVRGGGTDLDNLAIAYSYHNNFAPKQGWRTVLINGIPHWQPPPWHANQQPQRNYLHHPELLVNGAIQTPLRILSVEEVQSVRTNAAIRSEALPADVEHIAVDHVSRAGQDGTSAGPALRLTPPRLHAYAQLRQVRRGAAREVMVEARRTLEGALGRARVEAPSPCAATPQWQPCRGTCPRLCLQRGLLGWPSKAGVHPQAGSSEFGGEASEFDTRVLRPSLLKRVCLASWCAQSQGGGVVRLDRPPLRPGVSAQQVELPIQRALLRIPGAEGLAVSGSTTMQTHLALDLQYGFIKRGAYIPVTPLAVGQPGETEDVCRQFELGVARSEEIGALPTQRAHKQAELQKHVVARGWSLGTSTNDNVIGRRDQHSEVDPGRHLEQRVEGVVGRLEDVVPAFHLAHPHGFQFGLEVARDGQPLRRGADEQAGRSLIDRHGMTA